MKRIVIFIFTLLFFVAEFNAQTVEDSIIISKIDWAVKDISKGVQLKQAQVRGLYQGVQNISAVEIDLKALLYTVDTSVPDSNKLVETSIQAKACDALVAINGTYFDMKKGGDVNFHKLKNTILNLTDTAEFRIRAKGAFVILNNEFDIIFWDPKYESDHFSFPYENILVSGPVLIHNGKLVHLENKDFAVTKHPRSSVSITEDGKLMFVVFDGRHANNADGVNLFELAHFLKQMGADKSLNLDGGGSSTLYVKNFGENGVVNMPSDNKLFDHMGERKVASIIYIKE